MINGVISKILTLQHRIGDLESTPMLVPVHHLLQHRIGDLETRLIGSSFVPTLQHRIGDLEK